MANVLIWMATSELNCSSDQWPILRWIKGRIEPKTWNDSLPDREVAVLNELMKKGATDFGSQFVNVLVTRVPLRMVPQSVVYEEFAGTGV